MTLKYKLLGLCILLLAVVTASAEQIPDKEISLEEYNGPLPPFLSKLVEEGKGNVTFLPGSKPKTYIRKYLPRKSKHTSDQEKAKQLADQQKAKQLADQQKANETVKVQDFEKLWVDHVNSQESITYESQYQEAEEPQPVDSTSLLLLNQLLKNSGVK